VSNLGGGDQLASGAKSAQFASASSEVSNFECDFIFHPETIKEKYGLTDEQIEGFKQDREAGHHLPEMPTVEDMKEMDTAAKKDGFEIIDNRRLFVSENQPQPIPETAKKWPEHQYEKMVPILDRILIKRIVDDPNLEELSDGSVRNKKTGFIMPSAYRQHSAMGIVLAIGGFVIMGGVKIPLSDFIHPGDKVKFGDYNSEVYHLDDAEIEKLCDEVQMNFVPDPEGLRVIRVQDIRTIQRRVSNG
jgi:co-chaperonin GroES (HSP10)